MSRTRRVKGFTLIELMLVAALLAILGLAVAATFAGGLKIFNRMENYTAVKADILLSLERMERDMRSTFPVKGIGFIGEAKRMTFPAILRTFSAKGLAEESLGSVSYYRDDARGAGVLSREEKAYVQAVNKEGYRHGEMTELAPIEDIHFQYFSYDAEAETYSWVDRWDKSEKKEEEQREEAKAPKGVIALEDRPEELPLGVKIMIRYADGDKPLTLSRTIFIKTAVSLNLAKRRARAGKNISKKAESEQ